MSGFCVDCGHRVASFEGLTGCPACGTRSVPCADDRQVSVSVNWHELRILVMWAENWQREKALGSTVYAIARRLQAQHPALGGLSFASDMAELARAYPGASISDPRIAQDVLEQTGVVLPPFPFGDDSGVAP